MKVLCIVLNFTFLLSSCVFYKPAKINSPMLQNKGDGHIAASIGTGTNVNASYSPLENLVLIGNYHNAFNSVENYIDPVSALETELFNYKNQQFEFGIGYYQPKLFNKVYINLIAGYGFGESGTGIDLSFFSYEKFGYEAKFHNFFIQSTFGTNLDNDFVFGIGGKLNFLNFYDYQSTVAPRGYTDTTFFSVDTKILFQPFVNFRFNPGVLGFETYFGLAFSNENPFFTYRNYDFGVGLHVDIGKFRDYVRSRR